MGQQTRRFFFFTHATALCKQQAGRQAGTCKGTGRRTRVHAFTHGVP